MRKHKALDPVGMPTETPENANICQLLPTWEGKCQRRTDTNGAQTTPTDANMPTGLAGKLLLGVSPLTERVPEHIGKAATARHIQAQELCQLMPIMPTLFCHDSLASAFLGCMVLFDRLSRYVFSSCHCPFRWPCTTDKKDGPLLSERKPPGFRRGSMQNPSRQTRVDMDVPTRMHANTQTHISTVS